MKKILSILFYSIFLISSGFSQSTGKIAGTVIEKGTDQTLPGVQVVIKNTIKGTITDADGDYILVNLKPGVYDIEFRYIGFKMITITGVEVTSGLTVELDAEMEIETFEGEEIIITAEAPLVQKDVTSTRKVAFADDLQETPGIESTSDIFRAFGGSVINDKPVTLALDNGNQLQVRDQSIKDVHVRGGRGGEILFMVDGVPVTHPIYGGRSVLDLNVNDVSQVELITGAFNAEYGQAQSGVVNITTKSGATKHEGGIEVRSDLENIISTATNSKTYTAFFSGPIYNPNNSSSSVSYYVSSSATFNDTFFDNNRIREEVSLHGLNFKEHQDNSLNFITKIDWQIDAKSRLTFNVNSNDKSWTNFDWLWTNHPDNTANYNRLTNNYSIKFQHTFSERSFLDVSFGRLDVKYQANNKGSTPGSYWRVYADSTAFADGLSIPFNSWKEQVNGMPYRIESSVTAPTIDPNTGFFDSFGAVNIWRDDNTNSYTFKADYTSQFNKRNLFKAGVSLQHHLIEYVDIQDGGTTLSLYGRSTLLGETDYVRPPGPFPEFGQNRWVFDAYPWIGSGYVQDKFEIESLIINAGIRLDWFAPGRTINTNEWKSQWEAATGFDADWKNVKYSISPRFGISFPFSDKTVVFFSYGHFTQIPELQFYYRDPYTGSFTGNPDLNFEQTILYEFGFTQQLGELWAIDVKSYAKDISDQVGTTRLRTNFGIPVDLYDNVGYARARGLEFELKKKYSNHLSGKASYTAQWAYGYSSSAFEDYIRSNNDIPNPIRERRLSWDVRTQVLLQTTWSYGANKKLTIFGVPIMKNFEFTMLTNISSGRPYTPGTTNPIEVQVLENSETGPPVFNTDLKFRKGFDVAGFDMSLFVDVFNALDQKNVQIGYGFNVWTGNPFIYGDTINDTNRGFNYRDISVLRDPRQFSTGRYFKFGFAINF